MILLTDPRPPKNPGAKDPPPHDAWDGWQPEWTGGRKTPHDVQERQMPTEIVTLPAPGKASGHSCRRRLTDARLWEALSGLQQDAALRITNAYHMMSRGIGYSTINWLNVSGGASTSCDRGGVLVSDYVGWARECQREHISHSMIIDTLVFGRPLGQVDADRRVRKGTSRKNLIDGLDLYCRLHGWR